VSPHRAAVALLAAAAIAAGCGDDDSNGAGDEARPTPEQAESEQPLSAEEERGRDLFVDSCGSCHTLDAAGTQGAIGPSLDEVQANEQEVLATIAEGPGAMPENVVTGADAQAVAAFVAASGPGS
jgi:mono/diheme cytochrome c family protein